MVQSQDPAPGLGRGIAILEHLALEGACSLERIAKDLDLPKSSSARLLESLQLAGCVLRDPASKRYRATKLLTTIMVGDVDIRTLVGADLAVLATATHYSIELFIWNGTNAVMVDRADPEDGQVVVFARVGWTRPNDELDAINLLGYAHGGATPSGVLWRHGTDGHKHDIDAQHARSEADACMGRPVVVDPTVNNRGVLRAAAPLILDGRLRGMITLACPAVRLPEAAHLQHLADTAAAVVRRWPQTA